ncbi:GNAT family N-acetyltransferase [Diplocloster agilis]|uniref:GNAT family N-acetyltransferase n=1 Tax=Diplocloster agilis TaxID=2850323 RepID=UPI000820B9B7|nr:GNAT family N-acetyltransferase [Suonthocola fibrivorans]MCU6735219.1 GNAT family N-acetyltransferase [Suonthocola fibrivorans]SCJ67794.1 Protein of uncharacterised function (DUF3298) [uncultured Clostridium sp.]
MEIISFRKEQLPVISSFILDTLHKDPQLNHSSQLIQRYTDMFSPDGLAGLAESLKYRFILCRDQGELCGVSLLDTSGNILFLCVRDIHRNQGIEELLFAEILKICERDLVVTRVTVHTTESMLPLFNRLGFQVYSKEQTLQGFPCLSLDYMILPGNMKSQNTRKRTALAVIISVTCTLLILAFSVFLVLTAGSWLKNEWDRLQSRLSETFGNSSGTILPYQETPYSDTPGGDFYGDGDYFGDYFGGGFNGGGYFQDGGSFYGEELQPGMEEPQPDDQSEDLDTLADFPVYQSDDLPYILTEESYIEYSESDKETVDFRIFYPRIEGLQNADELNEKIKAMAMATANRTYLERDDHFMDSLEGLNQYYFASDVQYRVTYQGGELLSIVFEDHYFSGALVLEFLDIRTLNLNLNDGTVYETFSDIVNVDDAFQSFWYDRMLQEVPRSRVLNGLTQEQFRGMLDGEVVDGRYYVNYFLTADGFELGFTYHYNSGEEGETVIQRGWMSAPCWDIEMYGFSNDSDFWDLLE